MSPYYDMLTSVSEKLKTIDSKIKIKVDKISNPLIDVNEKNSSHFENNEQNVRATSEEYNNRLIIRSLQSDNSAEFKKLLKRMVKYLHINLHDYSDQTASVANGLANAIEVVKQNKRKLNNLPNRYKNEAIGLVKISKDAVILRRLHLVGLKMRIYMERQKAINAMEFLRLIKSGNMKDVLGKESFKNCIRLNKLIKKEIEDKTSIEVFKQYHVDMDSASSCILGFMTSVTYLNADLFETTNILTISNYLLMNKINDYDKMCNFIFKLYNIFRELQNTDYDVLYKKYSSLTENKTSQEKFVVLKDKAIERLSEMEDHVTENHLNEQFGHLSNIIGIINLAIKNRMNSRSTI